jgi:cell division initiation protein
MEMSPQRVRSAEFKTVRKGADPDEVRVFLNDVADELERAQNQSTAMEARARAAVARLQEVSESATGSPPAAIEASVDESETISRTLLLAQRTADTAVAEARSEAARVLRSASDEAATTLDSTREMAAQLIDEARVEARRVGEAERVAIGGEVEALKARRDFLESDVEQLELFLTEQRSRLRDAATSLVDITERIPGGLGQARPPLLSASDDESTSSSRGIDPVVDAVPGEGDADRTGGSVAAGGSSGEELVIATDIAEDESSASPATPTGDEPWSDVGDDPTQAMPVFGGKGDGDGERSEGNDEDFRFSFDDDRP